MVRVKSAAVERELRAWSPRPSGWLLRVVMLQFSLAVVLLARVMLQLGGRTVLAAGSGGVALIAFKSRWLYGRASALWAVVWLLRVFTLLKHRGFSLADAELCLNILACGVCAAGAGLVFSTASGRRRKLTRHVRGPGGSVRAVKRA